MTHVDGCQALHQCSVLVEASAQQFLDDCCGCIAYKIATDADTIDVALLDFEVRLYRSAG